MLIFLTGVSNGKLWAWPANPSIPAWTLSERTPDNQTMLRLLVYLEQKYPGLLVGNPFFHRDYFELLESASSVYQRLHEQPEFLRLMEKNFYPPLRIEVKNSFLQTQIENVISANYGNILNSQPSVQNEIPWNEILNSNLETMVNTLIRLGYAQSHYQNVTLDFLMKLPVGEKIDLLRLQLPEDLKTLDPQFAIKILAGKSTSKSDVLQELDRLFVIDQEIDHFLLKTLPSQLGGLEEGTIVPNAKGLSEISTRIAEKISVGSFSSKDKSALGRFLLRKLQTLLPKISTQKEVKVSVERSGFLMEEAPPIASLFLGEAGSDCNTQNAAMYSLMPTERIFLIKKSSSQKVIGYIRGSMITSQNQKVFYLNSLNGTYISKEDAIQIIAGLSKATRELGVQKILLPVNEFVLRMNDDDHWRLRMLVGRADIRDGIEAISDYSSVVPIEFDDDDRSIREFLDRFSSGINLATPWLHYHARELNQAVVDTQEIQVNIEKISTDLTLPPLNTQVIQDLATRIRTKDWRGNNNFPMEYYSYSIEYRLGTVKETCTTLFNN